MDTTLLIVALALLVVVIVLQVLLMRRKVALDLSPVQQSLASVEKAYERTERAVRDEIAKNRQEVATAASESRQELGNTLKGVGDSLNKQIAALAHSNDEKLGGMRETVEQKLQAIQEEMAKKLEQVRQDSTSSAKDLREEVGSKLKEFNESLVASIGEMAKLQKGQLDSFSQRLDNLTATIDEQLGAMRDTIEKRLAAIQEDSSKKLDKIREEAAAAAQETRDEVAASLKNFKDSVEATLTKSSGDQQTQLASVVTQLNKLTESTEKKLDAQRTTIDERFRQIQTDAATSAKQMREELSASLKSFNESVLKLTETNQQKLDGLKTAVDEKLKSIHEDNAKQLEQMRQTVDEKLQGTLEKRLGESFKQVSERLEAVHKGLGEMQVLATGVGDLKKVLSNVKTRAGWSEVQLGAMLEQVLNPDQYAKNVSTKGEGERVEFAVKLPGKGDDPNEIVWLPIDAKFPVEDHQHLIEVQETGDKEVIEAAFKDLDKRVKACANDISEKYLNPPKTTDFGILFLPTEGLFADVVRRTGLCESLQREHRVLVAGPTTLWALLNSLQMGFRTLAIQKRSSEVWNLLAAVKTEWSKYGKILEKVQTKLNEASNTFDEVARRSRAVERKLRTVQELPVQEAESHLMLESQTGDDDAPTDSAGDGTQSAPE